MVIVKVNKLEFIFSSMKEQIFIIEHLEPRVWKWCLFEYKHISKIVGKNRLWFTNIKRKNKNLEKLGRVFNKSARSLGLDLKKVCVLDPEAQEILTPEDSRKFDYFVFGGILGDYPPRKRTKKELTQFLPGVEAKNIGKKQMATDNAVYVVNEICKGKKFEDLKFKNKFVLKINEIESTELPYNYVIVNGKQLVSNDVINYLKRKKGF